MTYYGYDLGCRFRGVPHNIRVLKETKRIKCEICMICQKRFRWNKGYRGRTDNNEYLKAHIRNFAQQNGATQRIYKRIYRPQENVIRI